MNPTIASIGVRESGKIAVAAISQYFAPLRWAKKLFENHRASSSLVGSDERHFGIDPRLFNPGFLEPAVSTPYLVESAIEGDRHALLHLWTRYRAALEMIAAIHGPEGADLDDLRSEIAMIVGNKFSQLREAEAALGWMRTVAVNTGRLAGRRGFARYESTSHMQQTAMHESQNDARNVKLVSMLRRMPVEYGEVVLLCWACSIPVEEVAVMQGLPQTTIETRFRRGWQMFLELIRSSEDAEALVSR